MSTALAERPPVSEEFDNEIVPNSTLPALSLSSNDLVVRAELDTQITTAKTYPRNPKKCIENALVMATYNKDIADGCVYAKPVGRDVKRGPSIRLAEIMLSCWGNITATPRIVEQDNRFVTVETTVWDLESNVRISWVCRRRLTDKYGKPYQESVVENTIASATAISLRNATFKVIPKIYADMIFAECAKVIIGDAKSLAQKVTSVLSELLKLGVEQKRVTAFLGIASPELIDGDMLVTLRGIGNALRGGELTVEEAFPDPKAIESAKGTDAVLNKVKGSKGASATTAADEPRDPETGRTAKEQAEYVAQCEAQVAKEKAAEAGKTAKPQTQQPPSLLDEPEDNRDAGVPGAFAN